MKGGVGRRSFARRRREEPVKPRGEKLPRPEPAEPQSWAAATAQQAGFVAGCASAGDGTGGAGLTGIASCAGLGAVRNIFQLALKSFQVLLQCIETIHRPNKDHNNSQEQYESEHRRSRSKMVG